MVVLAALALAAPGRPPGSESAPPIIAGDSLGGVAVGAAIDSPDWKCGDSECLRRGSVAGLDGVLAVTICNGVVHRVMFRRKYVVARDMGVARELVSQLSGQGEWTLLDLTERYKSDFTLVSDAMVALGYTPRPPLTVGHTTSTHYDRDGITRTLGVSVAPTDVGGVPTTITTAYLMTGRYDATSTCTAGP